MKNSILLVALGLILLTGCSKDDSVVQIEEQIEEQKTNTVYVLNQINETATWETMVLDENQGRTDQPGPTTMTAHTEGFYKSLSRDGMTITWTGSQNENGTIGIAEIKQTTPNFSIHFNLKTECVTVHGNQAVYGGRITQVREISGNGPQIGEGWYFYFKVIDNNHERSVPLDKIANRTIFASPMAPTLCNVYSPNNFIWSSQGYATVVTPGFVVVGNLSPGL